MVDDAAIFRAMRMVGQHGGMICLHAENGTVIELLIREALAQGNTAPKYHALTRPALMEGEATHRGIKLAELAQAPVYFVHLSAKEALSEVVEAARPPAFPVFGETCPHYLFFDDSAYDSEDVGGGAVRDESTAALQGRRRTALWRALRMDQLQIVSTDHCPFCMKEGHLGRVQQKPHGRARLLEDPQRRARRRDPHDGDPRRRRAPQPPLAEPLRRDHVDRAGEALRPVSRARARSPSARTPTSCCSIPTKSTSSRRSTQHSDCDFTLFEGKRGRRPREEGVLTRRADRRRRRVARQAWPRPVRPARRGRGLLT